MSASDGPHRWMEIVGLSVLAAVLYGIAHDQVTIRICHEYFTVYHPRVFPIENLTLLALGWGVIATWWVGLPLGVLLAAGARVGRRPRLSARQLVQPLAATMLVVAALATAVGVAGYFATRGLVLDAPAFDRLPEERHGLLATCWLIHNASYWGGAIAGVALSISTWRRRGRASSASTSA